MYQANITRAEAAERAALVKTDSYLVTIDLSGGAPDGTRLSDPEATFWSQSTIRFSSGAGSTNVNLIADSVLEATLDGEALAPEAVTDDRLHFEVTEGEHELSVTAICRYSRTGEGLHRFVDPVDRRPYLFTQLEVADARRVFACFEQPDLKASFTFSVIAPEDWTVLSNSPTPEPEAFGDGVARWDFAPTPRISTYITAIVAGAYHTVRQSYTGRNGEIALSVSCRQSLVEHLDADRVFSTTTKGFGVFEEHFGEPYAFGKYDQVFVPEFNAGAMENAGCVTIRDEYLFRSRTTRASYEGRDNTILHELAHMWFGDLVTMTWWDDLWLNESFAEWASHFAQEEIRARGDEGDDPWATFCNSRKTWAYRQDQLPSTHPVAADMVDLEAVELNFDGITYAKGASVLRQLVAFVGRDAFLAGVRAYFAEHAFGNTQLTDLLGALEANSGRDLSGFAGQWLQQAGVNTLRPDFEVDDEGCFTRFAVEQTAPQDHPTLRQHRLAVGLYDLVDGVLTRRERLEGDIAGPLTEIGPLVGKSRPAMILLNDDDLTYAKVRLDPDSLRTAVESIHLLDSPVARAIVWGAAWDMCRDAELSGTDYIDLVLRGAGVETDLTAVTSVLAQARMAIDSYTAPAQRPALNERFTAGVARLLKEAEPGSDHQLAFARSLAGAISDDSGVAVLRAWLSGEEAPEGLAIDTDLRWRTLTNLARLGAAGDAEIDAELQRDNTAQGAEHASAARAAQPLADAKAKAWRLAVDDPDTPNETHFQICAAFWQRDQEAVLEPYVDRYLEVARAISDQRDGWENRSLTIRQHVLNLLFPRPLADREFLARLDTWMAEAPLSDSVSRQVLERRADAERALRCQEAFT